MYQDDIKTSVTQSPTQFIWFVKDQQVVPCPLGETSVEYIIEINTSRCEFKTSMQSESAIVSFTILKTFKEVEYFYNKLKSQQSHLIKFSDLFLNGKSHLLNSNEERLIILNTALKFISDQTSLINSREFLDFLGFDLKKQAIDVKSQNAEHNSMGNRKSSSDDTFKKQSQMKITREVKSENLFGSNDDQDNDDDDDLFKQMKPVNVSGKFQAFSANDQSDEHLMFERQDFGDGILKDEKILFMPLNANSNSEKLDKPSQSLEDATDLLRVDDSLSDIFKEFHKKPEKPQIKSKPAIKPKPNVNIGKEKAIVCDRPQGLVPTKPVPPPRTTLSAKGQSSPATSPLTETQLPMTREINILDYINKEENAQKENLDLF